MDKATFYRLLCLLSLIIAAYGFALDKSGFNYFLYTAMLFAICAGDLLLGQRIVDLITAFFRSPPNPPLPPSAPPNAPA